MVSLLILAASLASASLCRSKIASRAAFARYSGDETGRKKVRIFAFFSRRFLFGDSIWSILGVICRYIHRLWSFCLRIMGTSFFIRISDKFTALGGKVNDFLLNGVQKLTRRKSNNRFLRYRRRTLFSACLLCMSTSKYLLCSRTHSHKLLA